jgi:hypothetical protein
VAAKERTSEELREQSKHLLYEIQMLFALGRYCGTGELDAAVAALNNAGLPARNAVIEAFEIHARQLIEFLTHQRNGHRATARDWATGWAVPKATTRELKQLREAFSERVAHLSWKRSGFTGDEQLVMTQKIERKLQPLLLRFLEAADPETLCEGFLNETRAALSIGEDRITTPRIRTLAELDLESEVVTAPGTTSGTATQPWSDLAETLRGGS